MEPYKYELKQILYDHNVEGLKVISKELGLRGYSKWKKDELVKRLLEEILQHEKMEQVFLTATNKETEELVIALEQEVVINPYSGFYQYWKMHGMVYVTDEGEVHVPIEVEHKYHELNASEDYQYKRNRTDMIDRYALSCTNLYALIELDRFVQIINNQTKLGIDKQEVIDWCLLRDQYRGCFMYFYHKGYVMCETYGDNILDVKEDYRPMLKAQANKEYYIPEQEELLKYADTIYVDENVSFQKMLMFLEKKMRMEECEAYDYCAEIQMLIRNGEMPNDIIQECTRMGFVFDYDRQFKEFMSHLMEMFNNTRIAENRGHTPNEMRALFPSENQIPEEVVAKLKELGAMGLGMDEQSNVIPFPTNRRVDKKVYPNDLCPCGSGKKYKKCCGRNEG